MKKMMVGMLLIIPIIIVLILSAVTAIVSTAAHIGVEDIFFDKDYVEIGLSDKIYSVKDYLSVTVLPELATNGQYVFTVDEIKCLDPGYAAERADYLKAVENNPDYSGEVIPSPVELVDNGGNAVAENTTGKFKVNAYCSFNVIAQAETKTAVCLFYVKGETPQKLEISAPASMTVGENVLLESVCTPVDATVSKYVWLSSDETVISVEEGVASALREGTASVLLRAYVDETQYVESNSAEVLVRAGVSVYGTKFASSESVVELSQLGLAEADVIRTVNCTVTEGKIIVADANTVATVSTSAGTLTVEVCNENDIAIKNSDVFEFSESKQKNFVLAIGDSVKLSALWKSRFKSGAPENVRWSSSTSAATVSDGNVLGKASGLTCITASYEYGGENYSDTILLNVQRKLNVLLIDKSDASLAVGIARETVFADTRFVSSDVNDTARENNTLTVGVKLPVLPDGENSAAFYGALEFSVTENGEVSDKAYFAPNSNVLIFDGDKIADKTKLTVSVKAKYPRYSMAEEYTSCVFDVNVIDGVAVDDYNSMLRATEGKLNVSLIKNVKLVYNEKYNYFRDAMMFLRSDLYGNGNMVYSTSDQYKYNDPANGWTVRTRLAMFYVPEDCSPTISNVILRACEVGSEISTGDDEMSSLMGRVLYFHSARIPIGAENGLRIHAKVQYCILENCRMAVDVESAEVELEGSIIRNTLEFGLRSISNIAEDTRSVRYGYITLKNMLFSNTCGTAFSIGNEGYVGKSGYEQAYSEDKCNKLWQIGFLDVYNWQELNVMSVIPSEELGDWGPYINSTLRDIISSSSTCAPYRSSYNGVTYFHFAGLSAGLMEPTVLKIVQMDDKRLHMITSDDLAAEGGNILSGISIKTTKIWGYHNDEQSITPGRTYIINARLIDRLHGEV